MDGYLVTLLVSHLATYLDIVLIGYLVAFLVSHLATYLDIVLMDT